MANERARKLRKEATVSERIFWSRVRNNQIDGRRFRRQHPIGPYVVDFVCLEKHLVIEIDGSQHDEPEQKRKDDARTAWLQSEGYRVTRFWAWDVTKDVDQIIFEIRLSLSESVEPASITPT